MCFLSLFTFTHAVPCTELYFQIHFLHQPGKLLLIFKILGSLLWYFHVEAIVLLWLPLIDSVHNDNNDNNDNLHTLLNIHYVQYTLNLLYRKTAHVFSQQFYGLYVSNSFKKNQGLEKEARWFAPVHDVRVNSRSGIQRQINLVSIPCSIISAFISALVVWHHMSLFTGTSCSIILYLPHI